MWTFIWVKSWTSFKGYHSHQTDWMTVWNYIKISFRKIRHANRIRKVCTAVGEKTFEFLQIFQIQVVIVEFYVQLCFPILPQLQRSGRFTKRSKRFLTTIRVIAVDFLTEIFLKIMRACFRRYFQELLDHMCEIFYEGRRKDGSFRTIFPSIASAIPRNFSSTIY